MSYTVMVGNGLGCWDTMPMVRRTLTGATPGPYEFRPSRRTVPVMCPPRITSCIRLRVRSTVDFPQPDGPIKAVTVSGAMVIDAPSTARKSP